MAISCCEYQFVAQRPELQNSVTIRRASRSIATAAFVLALSFALLAIVPLRAFFEIAFAMAVGLLIDAFVVRALLVPALLVVVGPRSAWPGSGLRKIPTVAPAESEPGVETPGAAG